MSLFEPIDPTLGNEPLFPNGPSALDLIAAMQDRTIDAEWSLLQTLVEPSETHSATLLDLWVAGDDGAFMDALAAAQERGEI